MTDNFRHSVNEFLTVLTSAVKLAEQNIEDSNIAQDIEQHKVACEVYTWSLGIFKNVYFKAYDKSDETCRILFVGVVERLHATQLTASNPREQLYAEHASTIANRALKAVGARY